MAVLHKKEEKIQAVLGRLPKKYTSEQFVEMFIKLYSKDWGKIKSAYIKQSQDKEPGTVINMPKPEIYLKQVLTNYLQQEETVPVKAEKTAKTEAPAAVKKTKTPVKKVAAAEEDTAVKPKTVKTVAKKPVKDADENATAVKKAKVATKKTTVDQPEDDVVEKKPKAAAKKTASKK